MRTIDFKLLKLFAPNPAGELTSFSRFENAWAPIRRYGEGWGKGTWWGGNVRRLHFTADLHLWFGTFPRSNADTSSVYSA
jgi:hypothetical protein